MADRNFEIRYTDGEYWWPVARVEKESDATRIQEAWKPVDLEVVKIRINENLAIPGPGETIWYVDGDEIQDASRFAEDIEDPPDVRNVGAFTHDPNRSYGYVYAKTAAAVREIIATLRADLNLDPIELEWIGDE